MLRAQVIIFQDQLNLMRTNQFALDGNGLDLIKGQFEKCFNYVKQHHRASRPPTSADPTQAPGIAKDQFSLMAQKNTGLRVEDLKPPPPKRARQSSNAGTSPSMPSPSTPQNDTESPPKERATPRTKAATKARGKKGLPTPGDSSNAGSPPIKTDSPRYAASPLGNTASPAPAPITMLPVVEEESLVQKRQRERDEAAADPDAYIEKTLRSIDRPLEGAQLLAKDLSGRQVSFDFEPQMPPVVTALRPYSFASLGIFGAQPNSWSNTAMASSLSAFATPLAAPAATAPSAPAPEPFDFDIFIDSSAAGFDIDDAPTPELRKDAPGEPSPPSDDESDVRSTAGGSYGSFTAPIAAAQIADYDKCLGGSSLELPSTFSWSGDLPTGSWAIYGDM